MDAFFNSASLFLSRVRVRVGGGSQPLDGEITDFLSHHQTKSDIKDAINILSKASLSLFEIHTYWKKIENQIAVAIRLLGTKEYQE